MYVFPLDHPVHKLCQGNSKDHNPFTCDSRGKCPVVSWGERASCKSNVIEAWWGNGRRYNHGIHCGKSGLLVADEDVLDGLAKLAAKLGVIVPDTFTVKTAHGRHYYFTDTENGALSTKEGLLAGYGCNVRSGVGYVVGPGSTHVTGVVYEVENDVPIVPLPLWVAEAIKTEWPRATRPLREDIGKASPQGLAGILNKMAGAINGERNKLLYWCASRLVENSYPDAAFEQLAYAASTAGLPDSEINKTINSAIKGQS
jgi:hypothetical protein